MKTKHYNLLAKSKLLTEKMHLVGHVFLITLFSACQKNVSDEPVQQSALSDAQTNSLQSDKATVATDWFNLQLQMILHANPNISNLAANRLFGYTGITLFEAARFEIRNSISLHGQLDQMPKMPTPDNNQTYSWVISECSNGKYYKRSLSCFNNGKSCIYRFAGKSL